MQTYKETGEAPRTVPAACFGGGHMIKNFSFDEAESQLKATTTGRETLSINAPNFARFLRRCGTSAGEWQKAPFIEQCRVFLRYLDESNAAWERRYNRLFSPDAEQL